MTYKLYTMNNKEFNLLKNNSFENFVLMVRRFKRAERTELVVNAALEDNLKSILSYNF